MNPDGYVATEGYPGSKIFLCGEAPGAEEERLGRPFVGASGRLLDRIFQQAAIRRDECIIGNVARLRPPKNQINTYYEKGNLGKPTQAMQAWIQELKGEIELFKPNIVVALGRVAINTLCGVHSIDEFRGFVMESTLVPGQKVIGMSHPARILRDWPHFFAAVMDMRKAVRHSNSREYHPDTRETSLMGLSQFLEYINYLNTTGDTDKFCFDLETTGGKHSIYKGHCVVTHIGLCGSPHSAASFELLSHIGGGQYTPNLSPTEERELWLALGQLFANPERKGIAQNAMFDCSVLLHNHQVHVKNLWMDTMIAGHALWPELPKSLLFLSSICIDVPPWKHLSATSLWYYNCLDVLNTFALSKFLDEELNKVGVRIIFDREMAQLEPAMKMGMSGMLVDQVTLTETKKTISEEVDSIITQLDKEVGKKVNYKSPKQVKELLYGELGLQTQYARRKSSETERKVTTDEEALKILLRKTKNPVLDLLLRYRKNTKLLSTYLSFSTSPEGRVHTTYNVSGTETGRWSSSSSLVQPYGPGNWQNIPDTVRGMFLPDNGRVVLQADYSQAEAVVVAHLTGNADIQRALRERADVHTRMAALMFQKEEADVTKEERATGKTIRHAANYAAGPGAVANELDIEEQRAKYLLRLCLDADPLLVAWHHKIRQTLEREQMTLTTPLGRKRRFLGRWGDALFREAYAFVPQSTVGDLLNIALVDFYNKHGDEYDVWLQLHDAIYLQVQASSHSVLKAMNLLHQCMIKEIAVNGTQMTINVDFKVGWNWGSLRNVKLGDAFGVQSVLEERQ